MVRIDKLKHFNIYSNLNNGYIVHNTHKDFENGHTHINNYNTAKYIAYLALYKKLPKNDHLSIYLIDSVIRISDDSKYISNMKEFKNKIITKKNMKRRK